MFLWYIIDVDPKLFNKMRFKICSSIKNGSISSDGTH